MKILHCSTGLIMFDACDTASMREAVVMALRSGADLTGADLRRADLTEANLTEAELAWIVAVRSILPEGDIIGWKKLKDGSIVKLSIPRDAKRVGGVCGRKCRCEFAVVLEGNGRSAYDPELYYWAGSEIRPDSFDANPLVECSHGIHFFITRAEAEKYNP